MAAMTGKRRYTFVLDGSDPEQGQLIALLDATPRGYRARVIRAMLLDGWEERVLWGGGIVEDTLVSSPLLAADGVWPPAAGPATDAPAAEKS